MHEALNASMIDADSYRWVVDLDVASPHKFEMISLVGSEMFYAVAEIFLKVVAPDARILEQDHTVIRRRGFRTRISARKFVSVWSGKLKRAG